MRGAAWKGRRCMTLCYRGGCVDYLGYTKCFYAACASQVIFHLHGDAAWAIVNSVFYGPPAV